MSRSPKQSVRVAPQNGDLLPQANITKCQGWGFFKVANPLSTWQINSIFNRVIYCTVILNKFFVRSLKLQEINFPPGGFHAFPPQEPSYLKCTMSFQVWEISGKNVRCSRELGTALVLLKILQ